MKWKKMSTAPTDGAQILLAYPSFSGDGTIIVNQGRWIDLPPSEQVEKWLEQCDVTKCKGGKIPVCSPSFRTGWWGIVFITDVEHSLYAGRSYRERLVRVEPLRWMSLPNPPAL